MYGRVDRPFVVRCMRQDGREREFCGYMTRAEAERVAAHLVRVGCPARVVGPDDLALEVEGRADA